jgi:hypothetical protein
MKRIALGVIAGLAVWFVLLTAGGAVFRATWPEYVAVAESMNFTLSMMLARLALGAVSLLIAARVTAAIAPNSPAATIVLGALLLVGFIPVHISLWDRFPVWYHLTFLLTLIPLSMVGGRIGTTRSSEASA